MDKNTLKQQMKEIREMNLSKRIGDVCECPVCGKEFIKKHIKHVYCGGRDDQTCKNAYNNFIRYNTVYNFGRFLELNKNKTKMNKVKVTNKYSHFSFDNDAENDPGVIKLKKICEEHHNKVKHDEKVTKQIISLEEKLKKEFSEKYKKEYEQKIKDAYNAGYASREEEESWGNAQFNGCV